MKEKITNYIRAGYAGLYLVSAEEQRAEAELKQIAMEIEFKLYSWSVTGGIIETESGSLTEANDPLDALLEVANIPENSILLLKEMHLYLEEPNPILIRQFKDVLIHAKAQGKCLIIVGCRLCLPPELEREFSVIEFALPSKEELSPVLDGILASAKLPALKDEAKEPILEAASGLTTIEAENAFALSVAEARSIIPQVIAREKAQAVKRSGLLEIIDVHESMKSIGGLEVLKTWLRKRKNAFSQSARDYGLPMPKGLLIFGIPGTGKSLTAKATASVFGSPILKLDAGKLYGSLVGQSESNLRSAIATAEAIAPCVLWIDELDKGFSGSQSSGSTDGGTSARVFGSFLNWMQEKKSPVFVVATANDVTQLPSPLLRKGRFDELFFVDLPNEDEREGIWNIQIAKYGRKPEDFDTKVLAKATDGFTGSEIEQVFIEALFNGFEQSNEPTDLTIAQVLTEIVPLSKLMGEEISSLRNWAKGRARSATMQRSNPQRRKINV